MGSILLPPDRPTDGPCRALASLPGASFHLSLQPHCLHLQPNLLLLQELVCPQLDSFPGQQPRPTTYPQGVWEPPPPHTHTQPSWALLPKAPPPWVTASMASWGHTPEMKDSPNCNRSQWSLMAASFHRKGDTACVSTSFIHAPDMAEVSAPPEEGGGRSPPLTGPPLPLQVEVPKLLQ